MSTKKEVIANLADALFLVRKSPTDPFDADFAFGLVAGWNVLKLRERMEQGDSHFEGSYTFTSGEALIDLVREFEPTDHAILMARHAYVALLSAMAKHRPFKNVFALARLAIIKRHCVVIGGAWSNNDLDRRTVKAEYEARRKESSVCDLAFYASGAGTMALEALAMMTSSSKGGSGKFEIDVLCQDRTCLLVAMSQLIFAGILHAYAEVSLRFIHVKGNAGEVMIEFAYAPCNCAQGQQQAA